MARFRHLTGIAVLAPAALLPMPALACTLCHSPQAASVRERLLAADLWWNACAVALPLMLLLSVVALVVREPGKRSQP
ncbi:hypothetical protein [Sphingomonas desiccabilis]|uniref:Cytochrome c oxidase subunit II n=1 Tax=Sphingomonas desiccabilis TaxID=429134 RepID=A0A4Q2IQY2_9SPHN|nr:hypothetical protein [Sphingomonas desiccabilis]MBB3911142.1 hypothetical protein [Sphingomonas desiccabilis]RXZ32052.1 hypothetical protein EO081_12805 [Sphingomonas desiccabilis]